MAKVWPPQGNDSPSFRFKAVCCCEVHGPAEDIFEIRTKGGVIASCGAVDFTGLTCRRFKTLTLSGGFTYSTFDFCGDGNTQLSGPTDYNYSGAATQARDGQACVGSGEVTVDGNPQGEGVVDVPYSNPGGVADNYETSISTTIITETGNGSCQDFAGAGFVVTGTSLWTLSDEDLISDAIAAIAAQDFDDPAIAPWVDISATMDEGETAWLDQTDWCAAKGYYECQWRIKRNHLSPSTAYTVTLEIWRAPFDGSVPDDGDFTLFATQSVEQTTDTDGLLQLDPVTIPNANGFMTRTKRSTLTVNPS